MPRPDYAANLALFLTEKTGSPLGTWHGAMPAAQQRGLFGQFMGKGQIWINGENETVEHVVKVCFGMDYDVTKSVKWGNL